MIKISGSHFGKITVIRLFIFLFGLLSIQFSSCNIKLMEYEQPHYSIEFYDLIISKVPFNDSIGKTYGMDLDSMKLRYITDKGIVMSKAYYSSFIAAKLSIFHFSEAYIVNYSGSGSIKQIIQTNYYPVYYSITRYGGKFLFTTDEGNYLILGNVNTMSTIQISDQMRGTEHLAEFSTYNDKIAFVEKDLNYQSVLYIIDTAGNNKKKVISLNGASNEDMLSWYSDNMTIAYSDLNSSSISNICKVKCDGTGFVNLTNSSLNQRKPSYSGDGINIAFEEYSSSGIPDIIVIDRDGNQRVNITNSPDEYDRRPSWSQTGKYLLFFTSSINSTVSKLCIYEFQTHNKVYIDSVTTASWVL
ncbi:MAG: hypothetical protein HY959_09570 [Ignavibacteriae bacterium]|nr:hypothetical protein [Ignavibacteriota bacterium]